MNDFWRLSVGAILLGLAIFLTLNIDSSPPTVENSGTESSIDDDNSRPGGSTNPNWQIPVADAATAPPAGLQSDGMVRPVFQPPTSAVELTPSLPVSSPSANISQMPPVPQMDDRYRALTRFQVVGSVRKDNGLVPVQPKPSFGAMTSQGGILHRVRPGDTLQSIAVEYYGDAKRYLDIYLANKHLLSNPARLPEDTELRIPE